MKNKQAKKEKREFIRLDSVFPVEFQIFPAVEMAAPKHGKSNQPLDNAWHHGFTNNVSKGGMCLELLKLDEQLVKLLSAPEEVRLNLKIHIPIHRPASEATAEVLWFKKEEGHHLSQYRAGLKYDKIDSKVTKQIMRLAYSKVIFPRIVLASIVILFLGFAISTYNNFRLYSSNKKLIEKMVDILQDSKLNRNELENIREEKAALEAGLLESNAAIKAREEELNKKIDELKTTQDLSTELLQARELEAGKLKMAITELGEDKAGILRKIGDLGKKEEMAKVKLSEIKGKKVVLEKANFEKMYQWVKVHQNPRTGLIASFEGDGELGDAAFTYDQALSVIAFTYFKDYELARKILDFYLTKASRGAGFYNGYYVSTGEVSEFIIRSGPNLWLGIAVLQYTKLSGDNKYLPIAKDIAAWMIKLQSEDAEEGLRGGPDIEWYSTEHNLDGFAFFNMFYKIKPEASYRKSAQALLSWLKVRAYDNPQVPIKRGKGDATIATDTYAWSIASLGPKMLTGMAMEPEAIMGFAEDNCSTTVDFVRPGGESVSVKGFDFSKQQHLARGGVVSCEWTAQMVLSYKILSKYFASKSDNVKEIIYKNKAEEYLEELTKMVISSPSRTGQGQGCLPYASSDFQDTGHGWRTPKGKNTGSLSATIYAIFAYYGFNPLELE